MTPGARPAVPPWYRLPPSPALGPQSRVGIIGAGLAGCWLAFELSRRGRKVLLVDQGAGPASGASGNPAGVVKPFVTRDAGRAEAFHCQAFEHLLERLQQDALAAPARFDACGVMQLMAKPWPTRPDLHLCTTAEVIKRTGLSCTAVSEASGILFDRGGSLDPGALCHALVAASGVSTQFGLPASISSNNPHGWHVCIGDKTPERVDHIVLASGPALHEVAATAHLPITPARGQLDRYERNECQVSCVVTGLHWVVPQGASLVSGSTYQRDDTDLRTRASDRQVNRDGLEHMLGQSVGEALESHAGVRATTPDRLPFVGPVCDAESARKHCADLHLGRSASTYASPDYIDGLSVLGGFGSRGIITTSLSAHLLADWLCGKGSGLQSWAPELAPHRFIVRDGRKGRLSVKRAD